MVGSHIGCFEERLVSFNDRTLLPPVPPRTRNCICFMLVNLEQLKRSSLSWPLDLPRTHFHLRLLLATTQHVRSLSKIPGRVFDFV